MTTEDDTETYGDIHRWYYLGVGGWGSGIHGVGVGGGAVNTIHTNPGW